MVVCLRDFGKYLKKPTDYVKVTEGCKMESMHHNGVMVPPRYEPQGLSVKIKGKEHQLKPEEEERIVAWAKKIGTPYVEDPVFADNFHQDLSDLMGFKVLPGDIDYTPIYQIVVAERERRKNLDKEEKKRLRDERKVIREENKEKYGWATIDGDRCELGNYMVEPSSIFMGRGEHPYRGKWKEGPRHSDIEINLSPDAEVPPGDWKEVIWDSEGIWIARWRDKLSNKIKYVWPHDSSPVKQKKEREKFEKAIELKKNLPRVKRFIEENPEQKLHDDALFHIATIYDRYLFDYPNAITAYSQLLERYPQSSFSGTADFRPPGAPEVAQLRAWIESPTEPCVALIDAPAEVLSPAGAVGVELEVAVDLLQGEYQLSCALWDAGSDGPVGPVQSFPFRVRSGDRRDGGGVIRVPHRMVVTR